MLTQIIGLLLLLFMPISGQNIDTGARRSIMHPAPPLTTRGSAMSTGALSSYPITLPAGSAAGDTVLLSWTSTCGLTNPTVDTWTTLQSGHNNYYQAELTSSLSSTDITNGSVTVPVNCSGGQGTAILAVMIGAHTIREGPDGLTWACNIYSNPYSSSTSGAVVATDTLLFIASDQGGETITTTTGSATMLQTSTTAPSVGMSGMAASTSGTHTMTGTYTNNIWQCVYDAIYVIE
jgi:hypothetical protein